MVVILDVVVVVAPAVSSKFQALRPGCMRGGGEEEEEEEEEQE